jgi:murein DD-endopeptidase MepM/ murein hydrolase activator NlpD
MNRILYHFSVLCALAGSAHTVAQAQVTAPPSLVAPRRIIVPCQGPRGAVVEFSGALPNPRETNATIECRPPSGSLFPVGTNMVTCAGTDAAGNQVSAAFPVIVNGGCATDTCIELQIPDDLSARCNTSGGAAVDFAASASDRCTGGRLQIICVPAAGNVFPVGSTRVICTAKTGDRQASGSFLVTVTDDTPPEIHCPTNLVMEAQSLLGAVVRYEVTGKDDCAAQVRIRCSPPSGSVFPVGETPVFCEAGDGHGNSARCVFTVNINPARPLRVARFGSEQVELRWTGDAIIEATGALGEDSHWEEILLAPRLDGVERVLQLRTSENHRFFRTRPLPLLPPADRDGDGVPDGLDSCPDTPRGLAVDEHGRSLLELIATPDTALGVERGVLAKTLNEIQLDGGLSYLAERLQVQLAPSNNPALFLHSHDLAGAFNAQSNLVSELHRAVNQFAREQALRIFRLQRDATPLDAAHADVRPEDIAIMRLDDIETGLSESLGRSEQTLMVLSNLVRATSVRQLFERVRIVSTDPEHGTARLEDGRVLLLPKAASDGAPPLEQMPGGFGPNSTVQLEASPLPDGSLFGFEVQPPTGVNKDFTLEIDPTCLRLRVVPADPGLPGFDVGAHHPMRGYKWGYTPALSHYYFEEGMALAVERVYCPYEPPGAYKHWLEIQENSWAPVFFFPWANLDENSAPFVLKLPAIASTPMFNMLVREYRQKMPLGAPELLKEETYLIEINPWAYYAQAEYSRTTFELEDRPADKAKFTPAQVEDIDRQWPLTLQPLAWQTFAAQSYKVNGQGSTYPDLYDVHQYESFAIHTEDPNNGAFFAHTNDVGRGLYAPTISGFQYGWPFTYRVGLPLVVRDRLYDCLGGVPDTYYRIPFLGPLPDSTFGAWHVSQGNNGTFTHTNTGRYAFDFTANPGNLVFACRGGIVQNIRTTSNQSCYDPNLDNGPDQKKGGCTGCNGMKSPNFVSILHQDGTIGVYFHFQQNGVLVSKGQRVFRGDAIGKIGSTGCSSGPHVHVEVRQPDNSSTIPIRFECYDDDGHFRACYLPASNSDGASTNKPWWWPF